MGYIGLEHRGCAGTACIEHSGYQGIRGLYDNGLLVTQPPKYLSSDSEILIDLHTYICTYAYIYICPSNPLP